MPKDRVDKLKFFSSSGVHGNNYVGASGGITTFWNLSFICGLQVWEESNHVTTRFHHVRDNFSWILSNIYAPNSKATRKFWRSLADFRSKYPNEAWIVMRDFNTPINDSEKIWLL